MTTQTITAVDILLKHIRVLSEEIGPRGSTTAGERRGAEYCQNEMERLGLRPSLEPFRSARSIFHPHLLGGALMLAAFGLYPLAGRTTALLAALLSLLVLVSELLELGFKDNLFRRLVPKGQSQNVVGVIPPAGEHRQDLVLIGHIDTQRTPLVFRTPGWVEAYKLFTTVAFVLFAVQVVLALAGFIFGWGWVWAAMVPSAVCAALLVALCVEADSTPFTAGANDNASAVGMVLTFAEQFAGTPLEHTRVYCVCTGCEEVQHYGAIDFFNRHRAGMRNPRALVFELVGCAGPGWLTREGIIVPFFSDPGLLKQVEQLSARHPEWGAYPVKISGGNSELADCVRFGVPGLTLFGLKRNGEAPYWHQVGDTFDKIDPQALKNNYELTRELVRSLDEAAR